MDKSFYLYLHSQIEDGVNLDRTMNLQEVISFIQRSHNFPKFLVYVFLKEMEKMGMVQQINRYKIRVNEYPDNKIVKEPSKLLEIMGCWKEEKV